MSSSQIDRMRYAGAVGSRVAVGIALLTGGILIGALSGATGMQLTVAAATLVVAAFAWSAGSAAGRAIERHGSLPPALAIGIAGGGASLVVASATGAVAGAIWGVSDGHILGMDFLRSYIGRPALAVLLYGLWIAVLLGAIGGLIIHLWLRRTRSA
jgi:hypothetical protein